MNPCAFSVATPRTHSVALCQSASTNRVVGGYPTAQLLLRIVIMDALEFICGIRVHSARMRHDRCFSTGVPGKYTSRIIDLSINHNPAVVLRVMSLNLLACEFFLWRWGLMLDGLDAILRRGLHPASRPCPRLAWMSEEQHGAVVLLVILDLWTDFIPAVIHHAERGQNIP